MDRSNQHDSHQPQAGCSSDLGNSPPRKTLKCRNISALCSGIKGTYNLDTADVDFVFEVDGNEEVVPAHKCILAFNSPVFRQMLYGELKEKGDIKLPDTTVGAFIDLMKCLYDVKLKIKGSQSKIEPLLKLAHKYDVNWLEKECKKIIDQIIDHDDNATLWVLLLAYLYSYDELKQRCMIKIHQNIHFAIESPDLADYEKGLMEEILEIDVQERSEVDVFEMCINWAKKQCEKAGLDPKSQNIRDNLGDLFDLIRFKSMTALQFMQCLSINSEVFDPHEVEQIARKFIGTSLIRQNTHQKPTKDSKSKKFKIRSPYRTIESSLQLLLEDKSTADVAFVFKNEHHEETNRISAHKCMLASKSVIFAKRFKDKTKSNDEITIDGVSAEVFMYFLRLIYMRNYDQIFAVLKEVSDQHIDALLSLNKEYLLLQYNKWCTDYLINELNEQNVLRRFELSHKYSLGELKTKCIDLMKEKGEQIINSEAFMECSQQNLKAILMLRIWEGERSLAAACIKWAKKHYELESEGEPKNIRMVMGDLFDLIPFASMDPKEFTDFQREYRGMLTADEVLKVINDIGDRNRFERIS